MRHTGSVLLCSALLLCTAAAPAHAQLLPDLPIAVEARVAGGLPVGEFADTRPGIGATSGFGVRVGGRVEMTPTISLYGLYEYTRFGCDVCEGIALDPEVADGGFEAGVRAELPFRPAGFASWVSAGALLGHQLELSGPDGAIASDPAVGYAVGAGVELPIAPSLTISPGLHYRSYTASFAFEFEEFFLESPFADPDAGPETVSREAELDVSSVSLDIGLVYHF